MTSKTSPHGTGASCMRLLLTLLTIAAAWSAHAKSFTAAYLAAELDKAANGKPSEVTLTHPSGKVAYRYDANEDLLYIENTGTSALRNVDLRLHCISSISHVSMEANTNEGSRSFLVGAYHIDLENGEQLFHEKELDFYCDLDGIIDRTSGDFVFRFFLAAGDPIMIRRIDLGERTDVTFEWSAASLTVPFGEEAQWPTLLKDNYYWAAPITYGSSNEDVARIDRSGKITVWSCGTTTITAHAEATAHNYERTASYTLTVTPYEITGATASITLTEANTLRYRLADMESESIGSLTLSGPMGSDDLVALRNNGRLTNLQVLDMADVTLVADGGQYASMQTAKSDVGMGTTVSTWYLSEREETERSSSLTGLGGANVSLKIHTMSLGGLLANLKSLKSLTLPQGLNKVGDHICSGCDNLIEVSVPQGATEVGEAAFNGCTNLRTFRMDAPTSIGELAFQGTMVWSIDLGQVTSMGRRAFQGSSIERAELGNLAMIPENAFRGCQSLGEVTFGPMLTEIGGSAFEETAISSLNLPEGLTTIGTAAFSGSNVSSINAPSTLVHMGREALRNTPWLLSQQGIDGVVYLGNIALGGDINHDLAPAIKLREGTTVIADMFIDYYIYAVNTEYGRNSSSIDNGYFTSIQLPSSLRVIGEKALSGHYTNACTRLQYTLPDNIEYIGEGAFEGNEAVTSLTVPASASHIGNGAFSNSTSLLSLTYNATHAQGRGLFSGCTALEKVTFGPGMHIVPDRAFDGCTNLLKVTFADANATPSASPTAMANQAPAGTGLIIGNRAFSGCGQMMQIDLPANVDSIGDGAFISTGLKTVNLLGGVRSIADDAFARCTFLTTVLLPANIEYLNGSAFRESPITAIYSYATTPPQISDDAYTFKQLSKTATVYVLPDCLYVYDADPVWTAFTITAMDEGHIALGIDDTQAAQQGQAIFDLTGRRVSGTGGKPGIYIVNGRKVKL